MTITRDTRLGKQPLSALPDKIRLIVPSFRKILLQAEEQEGFEYDENELLQILIDLISVEATAKEQIEYYALELALDQTTHLLTNIDSTLSLFLRLGELLKDSFQNLGLYINGRLDYTFHRLNYGAIILQEKSKFYKELSIELNEGMKDKCFNEHA